MQYYTYLHLRGDTGLPFYVGKGQRRRAWSRRYRNRHWQAIVEKVSFEVQIFKRFADEEQALECERLLIKCYREVGIELANYTDGGDGMSGYKASEETRKKLSRISKERCRTHPRRAEWIAKIAASRKGTNNRGKNFRQSPETVEKIRAALTGRVFSDEHRRKLSAARRARKKKGVDELPPTDQQGPS